MTKQMFVLSLALAVLACHYGRPSLSFMLQRAPRASPRSPSPLTGVRQWSGTEQASLDGEANPLLLRGSVALLAGLTVCATSRRWRAPLRAEGESSRKVVPPKKSVLIEEEINWSEVSRDWEVDCFSRPVMQDGKKMWELMVIDANAQYKRVAQMKPTRVNSVVVQKILKLIIDEAKVKPKTIRFYRKVMKNMLTVALDAVKDGNEGLEGLKVIPSRGCHMMRTWLAWREREVYPKMDGYIKIPARSSQIQASMVQMSYEPLPERLRIPRYAISTINLGAIRSMKPGQIAGSLCRIPPGYSDSSMVHGVVILTSREQILCSMLKSIELCAMRVNLKTNELLMDTGIETTYLVNNIVPENRDSVLQFERAKRELAGLHFVAIHNPITGGSPNLPIQADDMGQPGQISGLWTLIDYDPVDKQ